MRFPILSLLFVFFAKQIAWSAEYFSFEQVPNPEGIDPQVGGMGVLADGRIAVVFHRGELMFYDPATRAWSLFASGLQEPLGLLVEDERNILVMQRAELTRIIDTDGDGKADEYVTVFDDFGMTGNYHEFSFGPVRDKEGNLYIVLGVASNGAPMREEIRGEFSEIGRVDRDGMTKRETWGKNKANAGRMYSRTPWRGWVLKLSPDGKKMEEYASGFRSPNGIGYDAKGRLLITDNQGDWRPTSPLYDVKKGGFYGHPASLVWKKDWDGRDPMDISSAELNEMQVPASGFFPQGELANSPTEPVVIPNGAMPDSLVGQTLVGEMNQPNLVRVLEDEVGGVFQVGMLAMFGEAPLGIGNHRIVFGKDGSMYVGKTQLSWAGSSGITRIKWNGEEFPALARMRAIPGGFELGFTKEIDAATLSSLTAECHTYQYHAAYGSPKVDVRKLEVKSAEILPDGKTVRIALSELVKGYLHSIDMSGLNTKEGEGLHGKKVWYQMLKVPE